MVRVAIKNHPSALGSYNLISYFMHNNVILLSMLLFLHNFFFFFLIFLYQGCAATYQSAITNFITLLFSSNYHFFFLLVINFGILILHSYSPGVQPTHTQTIIKDKSIIIQKGMFHACTETVKWKQYPICYLHAISKCSL